MKVKIIAVGKIKERFLEDKTEELIAAIGKKFTVCPIEIKEESIPQKAGENVCEKIKLAEGKRILERISKEDYVVALCVEGNETTKAKLKKLFERAKDMEKGSIAFVIGGSLGLHSSVVERADYKMSVSGMTFPHQLMRVMLLEHLFRFSSYL